MDTYSQNIETHEHSQETRGVVRVQFTDQYNPISNLDYRFRLPNGELEKEVEKNVFSTTKLPFKLALVKG